MEKFNIKDPMTEEKKIKKADFFIQMFGLTVNSRF
jgi:hypothetical protein